MTPSTPTRRRRSIAKTAAASGALAYADFLIAAERIDAGHIRVRVASSPAGAMKTAVRVAYPEAEARALKASFQTGSNQGTGRALLTQDEATQISKRLAEVLLPPPVFRLLAQGFAGLAGAEGGGLRVRLALDPTPAAAPIACARCPPPGASPMRARSGRATWRAPHGYLTELFSFDKFHSRDLVESILGFAAMSRFVIADLSEPRSIPQELQAIVPIINEGGREFATFAALARRPNVAQPMLRYKNQEELLARLESEIVPTAEALKQTLQTPA